MVTLSQVHPQKHFKVEGFFGPKYLTIKSAFLDKFAVDDGLADKLVLRFHETKTYFVVNQTNWARLGKDFGTDETDNWVGQKVTLTLGTIPIRDWVTKEIKNVATIFANGDWIRDHESEEAAASAKNGGGQTAPAAATPPQPVHEDLSDLIPF